MKKKIWFILIVILLFIIIFWVLLNNKSKTDNYEPTPIDTEIKEEEKDIEVSSIRINEVYQVLNVGDDLQLNVTILPDNATNKSVIWTSSNNDVATVSNGIVKGIKEGSATITASTSNGKTTTSLIVVEKNSSYIPASNITINPTNKTINIGESFNIVANIEPDNVTNKSVIWTSSNNDVATVSNGIVKGIKEGSATITASTSNGKTATCLVTINDKVAPILNISANKTTIKLGETLKINASNNTGSKITYESSNSKIATIDSNGNLNSLRTGTVTIKANSDGITKSIDIKINGYRLHFINIKASGDVTLLESNGEFALVDTGRDSAASLGAIQTYLDNYDINKLEFVILTHPHVDHNGGVENLLKKYDIGKIYMKHYTNKDSSNDENEDDDNEVLARYNRIIKAINEKNIDIVYVDSDSKFVEGPSVSGSIYLGEKMRIHFFNTIQRIERLKETTDSFDYFTSNYWASKGENLNSIVNLIRVNGHNALLTGDLNHYGILEYIMKNKVDIAYRNGQTLDVYKIPHHANYNCTGNEELKVDAKYYIATIGIDAKFSNKEYRITNDYVTTTNNKTYSSCFKNMNVDMCDAYYSVNSLNSIIVDFTNSESTISGGGHGYDVSNRCNNA